MGLRLACVALLAAWCGYGQGGTGSVSGTVVDQAGAAIGGAKITIDGAPHTGGLANSAGKFLIPGLPPGLHNVQLEVRGFVPKELPVKIEGGKEMPLGRVTLEVDPLICYGGFKDVQQRDESLPPGGKSRIFGVTKVETGEPARHLDLTLMISGTSRIVATTKPSRAGNFEFPDLLPDTYDVVVSEGQPLTTVRRVKVSTGHSVQLILIWKSWPQGSICL